MNRMSVLGWKTIGASLLFMGVVTGFLGVGLTISQAASSAVAVYLEGDEDEVGARLLKQMGHWEVEQGSLVFPASLETETGVGQLDGHALLTVSVRPGELALRLVSSRKEDGAALRRVAAEFQDEFTTQEFDLSVEAVPKAGGPEALVWKAAFTGTPRHSIQARQLRLMIHATLRELGLVQTAVAPLARPLATRNASGEDTVTIAVFDDGGAGVGGVLAMERIQGTSPTWDIYRISAADVRAGALGQFDVAMFTGGRGGAQGNTLGEAGREEVRRFVENGGGYLGICAGAFLATARADSYLNMLQVYHFSPWAQGRGQVDLELSARGRKLFERDAGVFEVRYNNGPLFFSEIGFEPDIPATADFEVLAYFRSGIKERANEANQPKVNTPAIVKATSGKGRLVLISPHPESNPDYDWLLRGAVEAVQPGRG
jgi:glutamine amidotransferase-like uncharacterized protein